MGRNQAGQRIYWQTAEVLTWICTRDLAVVQLASHDDSLLRVYIALSENEVRDDSSPQLINPIEARRELLEKCQAGRLVVYGMKWFRANPAVYGSPQGYTERMPIPSIEWCEPGASLEERGEEIGLWFSPSSGSTHWKALLYEREAVQALWPTSSASATIAAETRARKWLAEEIIKGAPEGPKSMYAEKIKRLYGVSGRGFLRVWDAETRVGGAEAWRKSGPKPKARSQNSEQ